MSLFQCEICGCVENTACAMQGFRMMAENFDWAGIEERKGKLCCSVCGPTKFADGEPTEFGAWHNQFDRKFLPIGKFKTDNFGNLRHVDTGSTDYNKYVIGYDA